MKTHTITINTWTINEHPNKQLVFDWIRNTWHDLGQFEVEEFVSAIENVAKQLKTHCDYSVSIFESRGEFIEFDEFEKFDLFKINSDCHYTDAIVDALKKGDANLALETLHAQGDYIYSDEGLLDLCEANEYEFQANGELY